MITNTENEKIAPNIITSATTVHTQHVAQNGDPRQSATDPRQTETQPQHPEPKPHPAATPPRRSATNNTAPVADPPLRLCDAPYSVGGVYMRLQASFSP